jgi:hypothetical protein
LNVCIIGVTLASALFAVVAIEGKLVAHLSICRSRDSRACDPQGHPAAGGDREPRAAFLSGDAKKANSADPLARPFLHNAKFAGTRQ